MGAKDSAYDNAVAESFFSNLKNELVHHCDFVTRDHARAAIFDYIELFYNRKRIHQSLGYRTPEEVEWSSPGFADGLALGFQAGSGVAMGCSGTTDLRSA